MKSLDPNGLRQEPKLLMENGKSQNHIENPSALREYMKDEIWHPAISPKACSAGERS